MKFIIICEERGVFIGTHQGMAFFSKLKSFGAYKAYAFDGFEEAEKYAETYLSGEEKEFVYYFPCFETDEKYVSLVDIIKAGYAEYTGDMLLGMPVESELIN
jgi:hypothetical protein